MILRTLRPLLLLAMLPFTALASDPVAVKVDAKTGALISPSASTFKSANGISGGGSGTVTSVSVSSANGISGSVSNSTTTPAITLSLGAITPSSIALSGGTGRRFTITPSSAADTYLSVQNNAGTDAATFGFVASSGNGFVGNSAQSVIEWAQLANPLVYFKTTSTTNFAGAVTIGGVAVPTISSTSTLTNKTISGASNSLSNIANASLTNSSVTIGGASVSLGGTIGTAMITGLTEDTSPSAANDFVMTYDASATAFKKVKLTNLTSGGGVSAWLIKTTSYTATAGDRIQADTSGGAWTLTLPASASGEVPVEDAAFTWGTNNLTIARNGNLINGAASDFTANVSGAKLSIVWIGGGTGWSIK